MENLQIHALWDCGAAQDGWASCSVHLQKCSHGQEDMLQLVEELISPLEPSELELFLVLTWVICHQQNAVTCGTELQQPQTLNARARDILEEFHCVQHIIQDQLYNSCCLGGFPQHQISLKFRCCYFQGV